MAVSHKNGIALSAIASINAIALSTVGSINGSTVAAPPPAGTPTAPTIKQHNGAANSGVASSTSTTLTNVKAGDVIIVGASAYDGVSTPVPVAITDSGGNTYAAAVATPFNVSDNPASAYMSFNCFSTVAAADAATLTISCATGGYRAVLAVNLGLTTGAGQWDGDGTRKSVAAYTGVTNPVVIDNVPTTYSHDLVLAIFAHYASAQEPVVQGDWAILRSVGDSVSNRLTLVGKAVTATGNYDPAFSVSGLTSVAGVSFVAKGKNL